MLPKVVDKEGGSGVKKESEQQSSNTRTRSQSNEAPFVIPFTLSGFTNITNNPPFERSKTTGAIDDVLTQSNSSNIPGGWTSGDSNLSGSGRQSTGTRRVRDLNKTNEYNQLKPTMVGDDFGGNVNNVSNISNTVGPSDSDFSKTLPLESPFSTSPISSKRIQKGLSSTVPLLSSGTGSLLSNEERNQVKLSTPSKRIGEVASIKASPSSIKSLVPNTSSPSSTSLNTQGLVSLNSQSNSNSASGGVIGSNRFPAPLQTALSLGSLEAIATDIDKGSTQDLDGGIEEPSLLMSNIGTKSGGANFPSVPPLKSRPIQKVTMHTSAAFSHNQPSNFNSDASIKGATTADSQVSLESINEAKAQKNDRILQQRLQEAKALNRQNDSGAAMFQFSLWSGVQRQEAAGGVSSASPSIGSSQKPPLASFNKQPMDDETHHSLQKRSNRIRGPKAARDLQSGIVVSSPPSSPTSSSSLPFSFSSKPKTIPGVMITQDQSSLQQTRQTISEGNTYDDEASFDQEQNITLQTYTSFDNDKEESEDLGHFDVDDDDPSSHVGIRLDSNNNTTLKKDKKDKKPKGLALALRSKVGDAKCLQSIDSASSIGPEPDVTSSGIGKADTETSTLSVEYLDRTSNTSLDDGGIDISTLSVQRNSHSKDYSTEDDCDENDEELRLYSQHGSYQNEELHGIDSAIQTKDRQVVEVAPECLTSASLVTSLFPDQECINADESDIIEAIEARSMNSSPLSEVSHDSLTDKYLVSNHMSTEAEAMKSNIVAPMDSNLVEQSATLPVVVAADHQAEAHTKTELITTSSQAAKLSDSWEYGGGDESPLRWKRGEPIGEGTFGKVYKGMNERTGELLAVKQLCIVDGAEADVQDLRKEINIMWHLEHENIVRYLGTAKSERYLFIILEYIPGGSIANMLSQFGAFSMNLVRRFTRHILCGVNYLHTKGIIHRDIKGANVLVTEMGVAKLADFGCSKQLSGLCTTSLEESMRVIRGSVPWMAPEVIKQSGHGRSSDIWSVGATVIEMGTGKPPWSEFSNNLAALFHVATSRHPPPIPSHFSQPCADLLRKCMVIDAKGRATANDLLETDPFIREESISITKKHKTFQELQSASTTVDKSNQQLSVHAAFRTAETLSSL